MISKNSEIKFKLIMSTCDLCDKTISSIHLCEFCYIICCQGCFSNAAKHDLLKLKLHVEITPYFRVAFCKSLCVYCRAIKNILSNEIEKNRYRFKHDLSP